MVEVSEMSVEKKGASTLSPAKRDVPVSISTGKGGLTFDEEFRKQATQLDELEKLCFTELTSRTTAIEEGIAAGSGGSVAEVSCASSTCSLGGNGNISDGGSSHIKGNVVSLGAERGISEQINAKLLKRTTSRHGRLTQRWVSDPSSHATIRLTTGCVPLCKDGKVLFVSASSKPAWIFPKGGWESDEKMEESALREAYEEAGIIGILGPRLSVVQYETRKARKRRLETEGAAKSKREKKQVQRKLSENDDKKEKGDIRCESIAAMPKADPLASSGTEVVVDTSALTDKSDPPSLNHAAPVSDEAFAKMRGVVDNNSKRHSDETSSIQSDSNYSQVRMSLFPLYVTNIKREWPENGRLRRAVPIDEAIAILEARPELQAALVEVKRRGLHLVDPETTGATDSKPERPPVVQPST